MALIPCPEPGCGKSVSSMATTCPHCGAPIPAAAAAGTVKAAGPSADKRELRVASDGSGDVTSIQEAVKRIPDGGLIRIAAGGVYNETISLTRPVTIVGESGGTQPVIQSVGQRLLTVEGATAMLRGLTFHCINPKSAGEKAAPEDTAGVWCKSGHVSAENCKFVCDEGTSLQVDGPNGKANLTNCQVEGSSGIVVNAGASVAVSKTQVKAENLPVHVLGGASLSFIDGELRGGMITINGQLEARKVVAEVPTGIFVGEAARAGLTEVQLTGDIRFADSSSGKLEKCTIRSAMIGIGVTDKASVEFKECDLTMEHHLSSDTAGRVTINGGTGSGGLMVYGTGHFKMENATWKCSGIGQGISVSGQARAEIEACQIEGKVSCDETGKVELSKSRVQVPQTERYASALSGSGEGQMRVLHCEILGNQASTGVYGYESYNVRIERSRIAGHAKAVSISDKVRATIENCDLRGNATAIDAERTCRLHQSGNRQ